MSDSYIGRYGWIELVMATVLVKRGMKKRFMEPDGMGRECEALMIAALALIFTGAGRIALDRIVGLEQPFSRRGLDAGRLRLLPLRVAGNNSVTGRWVPPRRG